MTTRIGLISDTHGLLRAEAVDALRGVHCIVHAGDIGASAILDRLSAIAPVTAVRGNNDTDGWALRLRETESVRIDGLLVYAIHDVKALRTHPAPPATRVVVSGHSHRPSVQERDGVLFVNPGSAGPRRFRLPVTVGELLIAHGTASARFIELATSPR